MDSLANDNIIVDRPAVTGVWRDHDASAFENGHAADSKLRRASGLNVRFEGDKPQMVAMTSQRLTALAVKRGVDIVLGTMALVALSPLLIMTAVLIRATSKGPALFRQNRDGLNGKVISVFKFRSMYTDLGDRSGVAQTLRNDPRVTPIGRFIRKTSIDELPQLLNVIRGDMSLIGPRPHPIGMIAAGVPYEKLVPYYHFRHCMKPGISGWAQANGLRGPTEDASLAIARIDHDVAYVQHFSIMLDIKIILKTLQREFLSGSGL